MLSSISCSMVRYLIISPISLVYLFIFYSLFKISGRMRFNTKTSGIWQPSIPTSNYRRILEYIVIGSKEDAAIISKVF